MSNWPSRDFRLAETDLLRHAIQHAPLRLEDGFQGVAVRVFGFPMARAGD